MSRKATVALTATAGLLAVAALVAPWGDGDTMTPAASVRGASTSVPGVQDKLDAAIAAAQKRLRAVPADDATWAGLGSAYVQRARITGDPSYYPKAQGALERSLELRPQGNAPAFVGMGALANARHDFTTALDWGRRAIAANSYDDSGYGVLDDAFTQLGRYPEADDALQRMLDLQPGVSSFGRASYHFEETGRDAAAREALEQALSTATDPADRAFCLFQLGELAFNQGDPKGALTSYDKAMDADASYDVIPLGRAKALAALGRTDEALAFYAAGTAKVPLPQYVLEYGELLESLGRTDDAKAQYLLLDAEEKLFAANGVEDDLQSAIYLADHGDAEAAVRAAQREWNRRHSVLVADALGWALHRAGRDDEALAYANQALTLGWRNATMLYHRGMIEIGVGRKDQAKRDLTAALSINPHFNPLQAPAARKALTALGGTA